MVEGVLQSDSRGMQIGKGCGLQRNFVILEEE